MAMAASGFLLFLMLALAGAVAAAAAQDGPVLIVFNIRDHAPVDDQTSVGMQRHDLSLPGFINGSGDWHAFPGHEHLFAASTSPPFGDSYEELIGGIANLPDVPLGREAMQQAAGVLSVYDPATTTDHQPLKRALASLKVMFSEAHRIQPIYETVENGWESGARVNPEHLPYIEHWDTMSYEINRANRTGKWDGPFTKMLERRANIRSKEEAHAVVKNLMLNADFGRVLLAHYERIDSE